MESTQEAPEACREGRPGNQSANHFARVGNRNLTSMSLREKRFVILYRLQSSVSLLPCVVVRPVTSSPGVAGSGEGRKWAE